MNEIERSNISHVRQLVETSDGKRSNLVKNKRAIIRKKDGLYFGEINNGQVIAISDDINVVHERLIRADKYVNITIRANNRTYKTLEGYQNSKLPVIYRIAYSEARDHGLIIAMDWINRGRESDVRLFYDYDKLINAIKARQRNNDNYYVWSNRRFRPDFLEDAGGIDALDVPRDYQNVGHLVETIKARQRAGSHEAFIQQKWQAQVDAKAIEKYGSLEIAKGGDADDQSINDDEEEVFHG